MSQELTVQKIDDAKKYGVGADQDLWWAILAAARAFVKQKDWWCPQCGRKWSDDPTQHDTDGTLEHCATIERLTQVRHGIAQHTKADGTPYVVEREEKDGGRETSNNLARNNPARTGSLGVSLDAIGLGAADAADVAPTTSPPATPECNCKTEGRVQITDPPCPVHGPFEGIPAASPSAEPEREEKPTERYFYPTLATNHNLFAPPSACVSGEGELEKRKHLIADMGYEGVSPLLKQNTILHICALADALAQCRTQEAACRAEVERLTRVNNAMERESSDWEAVCNKKEAELASKDRYALDLEAQYNSYIMQHSPETVPACTVEAMEQELKFDKAEKASLRDANESLRARVERLEGALRGYVNFDNEAERQAGLDECDRRARAALTEAETNK